MRRSELRLGAAFALGAALAGVTSLIAGLGRSWRHRVAIVGHSMEPTLEADDWLLVDPDAFRRRPPIEGDLVVVRDPRQPDRLITKRVADLLPDGRLRLAGDHAGHATDADLIGPVDEAALVGRPWFRYWPLNRVGMAR